MHTGSEAVQMNQELGAQAFTHGQDIFFNQGKYNAGSTDGKLLLAHEMTHVIQQTGEVQLQRHIIQCRGGEKVGELSINSNVINQGLTAGHAWLAYTPVDGAMTTYGTWGNREPIGLHRDLELGYTPAASRKTDLDNTDYSKLTNFASANNSWGYINNCASFAARGWKDVTGESLSYKTGGIPNPSKLGEGIVAANGGNTGTLPATPNETEASSSGSF